MNEKRIPDWVVGVFEAARKLVSKNDNTELNNRIDRIIESINKKKILNQKKELDKRVDRIIESIKKEKMLKYSGSIDERVDRIIESIKKKKMSNQKKELDEKIDKIIESAKKRKKIKEIIKKVKAEIYSNKNDILSIINNIRSSLTLNERTEMLYNKINSKRLDMLDKEILKRKIRARLLEKKIKRNLESEEKVKVSKNVEVFEEKEIKKYIKRPPGVSEVVEPVPEEKMHVFEELKKIMPELIKNNDSLEELNNIIQNEINNIKNKYRDELAKKTENTEKLLDTAYNLLKELDRVNSMVKVADNLFYGLASKTKYLKKEFSEAEKKEIQKLEEKINKIKEVLEKFKEEHGKYQQIVNEIKVFVLEYKASMNDIEIKAVEVEKIDKLEEATSILKKLGNILKELIMNVQDVKLATV